MIRDQPAPINTAHVDEAGAQLEVGRRLYVVAAVLTSSTEHQKIADALTALQLGRELPLHFRTERAERRLLIAEAIATAPLDGAILIHTSTTNTGQEWARARLLGDLLPRLEHTEGVTHVVLESRSGGDRHDRRTRDRLRRSRRISAALRVDHEGKALPMLWTADFVASSYVAAHHHGDSEPWAILSGSHVVDVTHIGSR